MNQGITRDGVLFGFMFSPEFANFMNARLGVSNPPQRPEVALILDIYRSAFARIPDDGGYLWMRDALRNSECSNTEAAQMRWFVNYVFTSPEYTARSRANVDYLTDLYDVFFRRNPDVGGFNYWLGQLNSGGITRDVVRGHFFNSAEWGARVSLFQNPALCQ